MKKWLLTLVLAVYGLLLSGVAIANPTVEANALGNELSTNLSDWELSAIVNLGGEFTVIADAEIETTGSTFTANVTTQTIGGAVEVYNIPFSGSHNIGVYTVTNLPFDAVPGEEATMNNLSFTIAGNNLTGSGTFTVTIPGVGALPGTVVLTGTKKGGSSENKEPEWVKHYASGLLSANDKATDVACDRLGNIYVTGGSEGSPFSTDYLTIKYDPLGNILWNVRYDNGGNDDSKAIEVDGSGNVYITGRSWNSEAYYDIVTIKYNTNGEQLWLAKYNGTGNLYDEATDMIVDQEGNVYVTGKSEGEGTGTESNYDYVTIKYNQAGVEQWVKRFSGPGIFYDAAEAIVLDHSGNVYVTGYSNTGTAYDYVTIKYNQAGVEQWIKRRVGTGNSHNNPISMTIDGSDNLFIAGTLSGSGIYNDGITIKYNSNGDELWMKRYNGTGNSSDGMNAIVVDKSGNIYVTGYSQGTTTSYDYLTIKYNTAGDEQWVKRYNGTGNSFDNASDISVDTSGNVYVTGYSEGLETSYDYATIKYDSDGNEKWVARYNESGNSYEEAVAIVADGSGNICVTGYGKASETNNDYLTVKYNSEGGQQWVKRYNGTGNSAELASACTSDSSGNVYVTGWSDSKSQGADFATLKYNPEGIVQWVARYNGPGNSLDHAKDIAVDSLGNVYVTGSSSGLGSANDYATVKYNSNGVEQWVARYNGPGNLFDDPEAIGVDESGNVYVTGTSLGSSVSANDFATIKYNSEGVEQWVKRYNGPGNNYDKAVALAIDGSGNIIVTGPSTGSGTLYDYATIKYTPDGAELWVKRYNGPGNSFDNAVDLTTDGLMNIYVTGNSPGIGTLDDYATVKYNSTGVEQWVKRYNGSGNSYDFAKAIKVDLSGNAFVTGYSGGSGTGYDYATIKYSTAGVEQWVERYNGPQNDNQDEASAIAIDDSSNVYVTGHCRSLDNRFFSTTTIKYNSNGIEQWTAINNKTDNFYSWDPVITFGGFDDIYVSGSILNDNLSWSIYETIKYNRNPPVVSVSPSDLTLAATGGSTNSFTITSNTQWTSTSNQTWLAVNPAGGNGNKTIPVIAEANPLITTRSATITVSASGVTPQIITVTQLAGAPTLSVSPTTLNVASAAGSTATIGITSNTNWTVSDDQTWLSVNPVSGSGNSPVTVTAEANTTTAQRTATVTVSSAGVASKTVIITQAAGAVTLFVSPIALNVASIEGSTINFAVISNTSWTISSDQTWLTINPASGTGNGTITLTSGANPATTERMATITVSATGVASKTVIVTQAAGAATLSVSPDTLNVAETGGSSSIFTITSNTGWTILSDQNWLDFSPSSGVGNGAVFVTAQANPAVTERLATVTISATGVVSKTITVIQAAGEALLFVLPNTLNVTFANGSTAVFTVASNITWTAVSNQLWLTVNPSTGTNETVTVTAETNPAITERSALVTVSATGVASQTVIVTQAAGEATLSVSPSALNIEATGGSTKTFDVTSNTSWSASSDQTWLTVDPASGTGNSTVTVTAKANPSATERKANVMVSSTGAASKSVVVTQIMKTGIEAPVNNGLLVYPNPFAEGFYVNTGNCTSIVSIYDFSGQLIFSTKITGTQYVKTGGMVNGMYLIELKNTQFTERKKLIKW